MPRSRRPSRLVALATATLLLGAGCTDDPAPQRPEDAPDGGVAAAESRSASQRLGLRPGWGPDRAELDAAARRTARLSLPELAGQVIVARWSGSGAPTALVRRLHLGGVVVFAENVASTDQLRSATRSLQRDVDRPWPLLVAVDQEGGTVARIRGAATAFPAFMSAGAAGDPALTRRTYAASGRELRGLGINVDLAPDADVTTGPADPVIGSRSAGAEPAAVARQAVAAARGFRDAGVVPVVKHFPGHGSLVTDSHVALPVQRRGMAALARTDLRPFRAAVDAGLPAVMTGHIALAALDPGVPASLSRPVVTGLLRERLGFDGVVMSDALDMAAVSGRRTPAVQVLRAGGDVVLMPPDPAASRAAIVRAVRDGRLSRTRLRQAAARTIALLEQQRRGDPAAPGSGRAASRRLSAAALTVVAGPCRGPLVPGAVVPLGGSAAVSAFRSAARSAGLAMGSVRYVKPPRPELTGRRKKDRAALQRWRRTEATRVVRGTPVHLLSSGTAPDSGVVVATDRPYLLGASDAPVRIATYGETPGAMAALVEVLLGRERAPGRLPVDVPGVPRQGC
ncbi:putative lipoprotein YbbD precursor [Nocardioides dokdonensis FR1436]|uniref:beta-N-acetylhexosaminidase n=1 Tax=Nocardioides dokdonensis FR1436 TaxID=1300347 RepID=A0A1A9GQT6_9ACTN|nr:glycoside hydrolase family 3 N-terminal domain-containing protein [Nocardioides dokdonensis]ANH40020.1 putative lipoprotein YbbD precursor [Nocardioides dokdonensis FR1436]